MQKKRPDKGRASACPSAPRAPPGAGHTPRAGRPQRPTHRQGTPISHACSTKPPECRAPQKPPPRQPPHVQSVAPPGLSRPARKPPVGTSWRPKPHAHPPRSAAHARLGTASILRGVAAGSGAGALRPKTTMSDWSCQASDLRPKPGSLREVGEEQTPQTARLHRLPWARGRAARLTLASSQRAPHASARTPHGRLTPR